QRKEIALRTSPGLLFEFALRHRKRVLVFGIFPFRDRPGAQILLGPERAARMHEQDLDLAAASSVHQNAGAALGHGTFLARAPTSGGGAHKGLCRAVAPGTPTHGLASALSPQTPARPAPRRGA